MIVEKSLFSFEADNVIPVMRKRLVSALPP
jgi:hypothetical protein